MARCEDSCPPASRKGGRCVQPDDDGFVVQCVGEWSTRKHEALFTYIEATAGPRMKFLDRGRGIAPGGAAYIDLFAGPGRARVRTTGAAVNGSPLIALKHQGAPFTRLIYCENDPDNLAALRTRTEQDPRVLILEGDCHKNIDRVIAATPPDGLNFAFVDPYSLGQHEWGTLAKLASVRRMDLLVHFSTMDAKRNFYQGTEARLTKALGTDEWQKGVTKAKGLAKAAIDTLRKRLVPYGYTGKDVRSLDLENSKEGTLYHFVFVSKDKLGDKIWESVARARGEQRSLL